MSFGGLRKTKTVDYGRRSPEKKAGGGGKKDWVRFFKITDIKT